LVERANPTQIKGHTPINPFDQDVGYSNMVEYIDPFQKLVVDMRRIFLTG